MALWALAYEEYDTSLVSDAKFDATSIEVHKNRKVKTGHDVLDKFFAKTTGKGFDPSTGSWVHDHPEYDKLDALFQRLNKTGVLHAISNRQGL